MTSIYQENKDLLSKFKSDAKENASNLISSKKRNITFAAAIVGILLFTFFAIQILQGLLALLAAVIIIPLVIFILKTLKANDKYINQYIKEVLKYFQKGKLPFKIADEKL